MSKKMTDEVKARLRELAAAKKRKVLKNVSPCALVAMAADHFDESGEGDPAKDDGSMICVAYLSYARPNQIAALAEYLKFIDVIVSSRVGNRIVRCFSYRRLYFALTKLGLSTEKYLRPANSQFRATPQNITRFRPLPLGAKPRRR